MSITDELKDFANSGMSAMECAAYSDKLIAIADRIDERHKHAIGYVDDRDLDTMTENGWIRLPKDVDGEYIHMGDKMECFTSQHRDVPKVFEVQRIIMDDITGWRLVAYPATYVPEECRHYHASTVEDVLRKFTDAILDWAGKSGTVAEVGTWSDVAAEYIAKLQLKED